LLFGDDDAAAVDAIDGLGDDNAADGLAGDGKPLALFVETTK
jgi:hypothetical protein